MYISIIVMLFQWPPDFVVRKSSKFPTLGNCKWNAENILTHLILTRPNKSCYCNLYQCRIQILPNALEQLIFRDTIFHCQQYKMVMLFACRFWAIIPNQFSVFWLWFETCGPFCVWSICKQKWLKNIFIRTKVLPNCCPWAYYLSNRNQIHMNREHFRSSNLHFHFSLRWNY